MCKKCNKLVCECTDDAFIRRGPRGKQGPKGNTGTGVAVPGPQGIQGPAGVQGPKGDIGSTGLSAYQVWLGQGNTGTQQDFLDSLKGTNGGFPNVGIGTTTTLPSGTPANVNTAGSTLGNVVLNFGIPTGPAGDKGDKGDKGDPGAPGANCMIFKHEAGAALVPGSFRVLGGNNFDQVTSLEISKTSMLGYSGSVATANNAQPWIGAIAIESVIQLTNTNDSTNFGIYKVGAKNTTGLGVVLLIDFVAGNGIANAANSVLTICYNVPCIAEPANVNPTDGECASTGDTPTPPPSPVPGSGCGCFPVGMVSPFAGTANPPEGWLVCDGSAKLAAEYPALAAVLGSTYGTSAAGTFKLPNLSGKVIAGPGSFGSVGSGVVGQVMGDNDVQETIPLSVTGELDESNLPAHTHSISVNITEGGNHRHLIRIRGTGSQVGPGNAAVDPARGDVVEEDSIVNPIDLSKGWTQGAANANDGAHTHAISASIGSAGVVSPQPFDLNGNAQVDFSVIQATVVMRYMIKF